jgi:two-component system, sensor histidine kinase
MSEESEADRRADWVRLLAHDLRAPITALTASVGFLELRHADLDSQYLLAAARDALSRLARIVDNIEVRGQILEGMEPARERIDVAALVREVAAQLHASLALRDERLDLNIDEEPLILSSDPDIMRVLVANALLNSIESSPLKGLITIGAHRRDARIELAFSDEGAGVPADLAGAAADDFGQLELRRQSVRIGRGLTLVAVQLAARVLGGTIRLGSTAGRGCCLTVSLPFTE